MVFHRLKKLVRDEVVKITQPDQTAFYWSERFRAARAIHDEIEKHLQLSQLSNDFKTFSSHYTETIINELSLPRHLRSLKPVDVGGLAGGSKFVTWYESVLACI